MLISVCGGICAGKHAIAEYLIQRQDFRLLRLKNNHRPLPADDQFDHAHLQYYEVKSSQDHQVRELSFESSDALLEFAAKRWTERWVTINTWDAAALDRLLKRPYTLLVSVDAPLKIRWKRFSDRCRTWQIEPPTLENFVEWSDTDLYGECVEHAHLIYRAQLRLFNGSTSLSQLHTALDALNLTDNERLRPGWDQYFMQLASLAAQRSNCMKRRVGCVIVRDHRVISTGYNGTPRHLKNCNEGGCPRCNRGENGGVGLSTCLCIHAEENALLEAGRERIGEGSVLYCDTFPCLTCTVKIAQVGISEVVYSQNYVTDQQSAAILKDAGVRLRQFSPVSSPFTDLKAILSRQPRNGLVYL